MPVLAIAWPCVLCISSQGSRNIEEVFNESGVPPGKYIEVTAVMEPELMDAAGPVLESVQVVYSCGV